MGLLNLKKKRTQQPISFHFQPSSSCARRRHSLFSLINRPPTPTDGVVLPVYSPAAPLHGLPLRPRRGPPRLRHPPLLRQHRAAARAHARSRPVRPRLPPQEARQVARSRAPGSSSPDPGGRSVLGNDGPGSSELRRRIRDRGGGDERRRRPGGRHRAGHRRAGVVRVL